MSNGNGNLTGVAVAIISLVAVAIVAILISKVLGGAL